MNLFFKKSQIHDFNTFLSKLVQIFNNEELLQVKILTKKNSNDGYLYITNDTIETNENNNDENNNENNNKEEVEEEEDDPNTFYKGNFQICYELLCNINIMSFKYNRSEDFSIIVPLVFFQKSLDLIKTQNFEEQKDFSIFTYISDEDQTLYISTANKEVLEIISYKKTSFINIKFLEYENEFNMSFTKLKFLVNHLDNEATLKLLTEENMKTRKWHFSFLIKSNEEIGFTISDFDKSSCCLNDLDNFSQYSYLGSDIKDAFSKFVKLLNKDKLMIGFTLIDHQGVILFRTNEKLKSSCS